MPLIYFDPDSQNIYIESESIDSSKIVRKISNTPRGKGFGLANFATQSTELVQTNKCNYSMNNTSRSGCSLIHKNCLKISNNIKNWMKEIVRNNAFFIVGQGKPA